MSRSFTAYVVTGDAPEFSVWVLRIPGRTGCRPHRVVGGLIREQAESLVQRINGGEDHDYKDRVTDILLSWEET